MQPSKWPKTIEPRLVSNHTTDYQGTKINWILLINTFAILYYLSLHVVSGLITGLLMYSAHFLFTKGKKRDILFLSKYATTKFRIYCRRRECILDDFFCSCDWLGCTVYWSWCFWRKSSSSFGFMGSGEEVGRHCQSKKNSPGSTFRVTSITKGFGDFLLVTEEIRS